MVDTGHAQDPGVGDELGGAPGDNILYYCIGWWLLPYEVIGDNEVITVDENPWDVAAKEDHDNTHEDERQVDLTFDRIPWSYMGIPEHKH